jgi:uncharacterized protein YndB with AHSA1/START domain
VTTAQAQTSLRMIKHIRAPRQKVFDAWTRPELLSRWMGPVPVTVQSVDLDARVGGRYRIVMDKEGTKHIATGEYVEIVPGRKLAMTWGWEGPARYDTLLTVLFDDKDGGTELTLIHERFATAEEMGHHEHGWIGSLDKLAAAVEGQIR